MAKEFKETVFSYIVGEKFGTLTTGETKIIKVVNKLIEEGVEGAEITSVNHDGSIVAHVPVRCFKLRPVTKRVMSPEEAERRREWMIKMRGMKNNVSSN
jgi:hypothetical protein